MEQLLREAWSDYGDEALAFSSAYILKIPQLRQTAAEKFPDIKKRFDGKAAGTISLSDAKVLYLLIRTLKPAVVFEVGTWIGNSAMVMATAMKENGYGHIYTCDHNDYYCLDATYDTHITRLSGHSSEVITSVPDNIDLVFADVSIDKDTARVLLSKMSDGAVFCTHDFFPLHEKGVANVLTLQKVAGYTFDLSKPTLLTHPFDLYSSIAVLTPTTTARHRLAVIGSTWWLTLRHVTARIMQQVRTRFMKK